jgi:hypothetical protein
MTYKPRRKARTRPTWSRVIKVALSVVGTLVLMAVVFLATLAALMTWA